MTLFTTVEEAAHAVSAGKGEHVLAQAKTLIADMKYAVHLLAGESTEVLTRTSKSTGTKRLSFVVGKVHTNPNIPGTTREITQNAAVLGKAEELFDYLTWKGLTVERVNLPSSESGTMRHAVEVVLDDKVLGYDSGRKAATIVGRGGVAKDFGKM
jgi:hypothetical protein